MASENNGAFIRNIAEVPWREFPNHFGGALSKPLVMPETAGSRHIDYRISMYQPMAHVARHKHLVQEQIYHVLEGEGLMEIAGKSHVVRKHDFIFLPPGVEHAISNSGLIESAPAAPSVLRCDCAVFANRPHFPCEGWGGARESPRTDRRQLS